MTGEVGEQRTDSRPRISQARRNAERCPRSGRGRGDSLSAHDLTNDQVVSSCSFPNGFMRRLTDPSNLPSKVCATWVSTPSTSYNKSQRRWAGAMLHHRVTLTPILAGHATIRDGDACPKSFDAGPWRFWGQQDTAFPDQSRAFGKASVSHLKEDLHLYGMALSQWSDQIVRKLEPLVNSYADAYRMQIHRFRGTSDSAVESGPAPGRSRALAELAPGKQRCSYGYSCMNKER